MARLSTFPTLDLTSFPLDDQVVAAAKKAAYLTIGLGVSVVERIDSARRAAGSVASDTLDSMSAAVSGAVERVGKLVA